MAPNGWVDAIASPNTYPSDLLQVVKGQTCEQATNAVGGIARAIYDRVFKWLIEKCNDTLIGTNNANRHHYNLILPPQIPL